MGRTLAVDFGTSNTVIASWDPARKSGTTVHIPEYGKSILQGDESISLIPSLIHYTDSGARWIGSQVLQKQLYHSRQTFRWMKQYISHRSPMKIRINGDNISPFDAGEDFLSGVLAFSGLNHNRQEDEVVFSVPVEAFEHYENWLAGVAERIGLPRFRLIDEPSAAALGYSVRIQPGSVFLIFDFGGGTLNASVVRMEETDTPGSRRCRVLGKAGKSIGGARIDQWIFEEILKQNGLQDGEEAVRLASTQLLVEAERIKERLSTQENVEIQPFALKDGRTITGGLSLARFEELLGEKQLYSEIEATLRNAVNAAQERGYGKEEIQAALLVGGSSLIPSVQRKVQQMFGAERVSMHRPMDAVARGAAAFAAGVDFFDHIQHDYAIRYVDSTTGSYQYKIVVQRGTPYPTDKPIACLKVRSSYTGQRELGLAIFEMGPEAAVSSSPLELIFDPSGAARIVPISPQQTADRSLFWMNEHHPTFLLADPPAEQAQTRFSVEFGIDDNKRLVISAQDLISGELLLKDFPVVRLS